MPIQIPDNVRGRLIGRIRTLLGEVSLNDFGVGPPRLFRAFDEEAAGLLRQLSARDRTNIDEALGSAPLFTFLNGKLGDFAAADEIRVQVNNGETPLRNLLTQGEQEALAARLIDELAALPHSYIFSVPLSRQLTRGYRELNLEPAADERFIMAGQWEHVAGTPPILPRPDQPRYNALADLVADIGVRTAAAPVDDERVYLHLGIDGYVSRTEPSETEAAATRLVKSFFGIALTLGLIQSGYRNPRRVIRCDIHQVLPEGFQSAGYMYMSDRETRVIESLRTPNDLTGLRYRSQLGKLASLFSRPDSAQRIKLAGKWLFDHFAEDDAPMRVMHLAIATEVLLGSDGGEVGLTKTLATRLSYLIANSASERDALHQEFTSIYQLRSKIVHNGLQRLSIKEHQMLRRFRELTSRVVAAEIRLALRDVQVEEVEIEFDQG